MRCFRYKAAGISKIYLYDRSGCGSTGNRRHSTLPVVGIAICYRSNINRNCFVLFLSNPETLALLLKRDSRICHPDGVRPSGRKNLVIFQ